MEKRKNYAHVQSNCEVSDCVSHRMCNINDLSLYDRTDLYGNQSNMHEFNVQYTF